MTARLGCQMIGAWVAVLAYVVFEAWIAPVVPNEPDTDPFAEVDAVVFQFPERKPGGGWCS